MTIHLRHGIRISTDVDWTGLAPYQWSAIAADEYDGAPDSANRNEIGWGESEDEAIADLMLTRTFEVCRHECGDGECQLACGNGGRCPLEDSWRKVLAFSGGKS